jgi:hypothetical protein
MNPNMSRTTETKMQSRAPISATLLLVLGATCVGAWGCTGGERPDVGTDLDGSVLEDAPIARGVLRLGEGQYEFRAIEDGDVLQLAVGCQGSQHVWITLRSERMDPRGMMVELSLRGADDGELVSIPLQLRLSFTPDPSGQFAQLTGLTLQVPRPEFAIGRDLILRGRIEDRQGIEASAERRVRVEWGTEGCAPQPGVR